MAKPGFMQNKDQFIFRKIVLNRPAINIFSINLVIKNKKLIYRYLTLPL